MAPEPAVDAQRSDQTVGRRRRRVAGRLGKKEETEILQVCDYGSNIMNILVINELILFAVKVRGRHFSLPNEHVVVEIINIFESYIHQFHNSKKEIGQHCSCKNRSIVFS